MGLLILRIIRVTYTEDDQGYSYLLNDPTLEFS